MSQDMGHLHEFLLIFAARYVERGGGVHCTESHSSCMCITFQKDIFDKLCLFSSNVCPLDCV